MQFNSIWSQRRRKVQKNFFSAEVRAYKWILVCEINQSHSKSRACGFIWCDLKIYIKINCPAAAENTNKINKSSTEKLPRHKQTFNLSTWMWFVSNPEVHTQIIVLGSFFIYCLKFESSSSSRKPKNLLFYFIVAHIHLHLRFHKRKLTQNSEKLLCQIKFTSCDSANRKKSSDGLIYILFCRLIFTFSLVWKLFCSHCFRWVAKNVALLCVWSMKQNVKSMIVCMFKVQTNTGFTSKLSERWTVTESEMYRRRAWQARDRDERVVDSPFWMLLAVAHTLMQHVTFVSMSNLRMNLLLFGVIFWFFFAFARETHDYFH